MNLKEIKEIIAAITEQDITEFELERGEEKIRIKRGPASGNHSNQSPYVLLTSSLPSGQVSALPSGSEEPTPPSQDQAHAKESKPPSSGAVEAEQDLTMVTAPIVGTFYEAPSPGTPAFVEIGDKVEAGQVLCIIEAMKLMNEIEAETGGVVVKRFVENAQPVEYGEALFAIKADG